MNFEFWINGELSKVGYHFSNKVIRKLILSKNVNKKCAPKLVFFNEKWKKIYKGLNDFWIRKLTLKVNFWHFLTASPEIFKKSVLNNSNGSYTFMCLGRAGHFGQWNPHNWYPQEPRTQCKQKNWLSWQIFHG